MTYNVESIEQLGPALGRFVRRVLPALNTALRSEIGERMIVELVDRSPKGHPKRDPHPGKYQASHVPALGRITTKVLPNQPAYTIPGPADVAAASRSGAAEESLFIANAAADERRPDESYAALLEGGRRQYSRVKSRTTMWIGSEQAPEGIYGPSLNALVAAREAIQTAAVRRVERALGGGRR